MLVVPGGVSRDTCDGVTRRELLRVGGSALLGLSLADILAWERTARAEPPDDGAPASDRPARPGWGKAKGVILIFLQGGPSHLDLWDPKRDVPDNVRSPFQVIGTKTPGMDLTELLPRLAEATDKFTLIRSMSYSPEGLFNHTAAIYQMLTGYAADNVSPSGQLDPPSPKDFPHFGAHIARLRPPATPMLPFVMMPRPLQESNIIGKGGTAGFLGRAYDPYLLYPPGDDFDNERMDRVQAEDLSLRPEVLPQRMERRARLREAIVAGMPEIDRAVARYDLPQYYEQALGLVLSGRAREAFDLAKEPADLRDRYGRNQFGQSLLLARRLIEAGTRVVEVNWPKVANSDRHSWDMHNDLPQRIRDLAAPMLDAGLAALLADMDARGLLDDILVVAVGEFGRAPQRGVSTSGNGNSADGRDHWPYCFTALAAGAGVRRGFVFGRSDATGSAPLDDPVHPTDLLATIYHAVGLNPHTIVHNHLNQPREMVQGQPVTALFG